MNENGRSTNGNANGRSLVTRESTLMEYSPRDMAFVEFNPGYRQHPASLRDYLRVLFKHKNVIFISFLAVTGTVFVGLQLRTPQYEAHVKLLIRAEKQVESQYYRDLEDSLNTEMALTQSEIVKSNPVLERTVRELQLDRRDANYENSFSLPLRRFLVTLKKAAMTPSASKHEPTGFSQALKDLRNRIRVKPISNTNLFSISVRDFDPQMAAIIANTVSRYYIIFDLEQQLAELQTKYGEKHPSVMQFQEDIRRLQEEMTKPSGSYADIMGPASVKILEKAPEPTDPIGFPAPLLLLLSAVCGLCLGIGLAFILEKMDPTVRSADDVYSVLNLSLLGSVPEKRFGNKLLKDKPLFNSRYTKSFESLADQMHILLKRDSVRSVLVTSPSKGTGTTLVTYNLASYLSRNLARKVLIIDANFRQPSLHKYHNGGNVNGGGLAGVLAGRVAPEEAVWQAGDGLGILPAGTAQQNPLSLLDSTQFSELMAKYMDQYDTIFIDSANLKDFRDAELLCSAADGVIVVLEPGRERRQTIKACLASLEQKKANLLGAILNKRVFPIPEIFYSRA